VWIAALFCCVFLAGCSWNNPDQDENTLIINSYQADEKPRAVMIELVQEFEQIYPDIKVELNTFAHEDFKTLLRTWLPSSQAPDVVTWFAGERMKTFAEKDLLEPLGDVVDNKFEALFPQSFLNACSHNGELYFIPQAWAWWGVFYRKSIFEKLDLQPPTNWEEFIAVCSRLKEADYIPLAIGTKFLWPSAGYFDAINLRINGLEFHEQLMAGKASYTDPRVKAVFTKWRELVDAGFFLQNHSSFSWQQAATRVFSGEAAMYFIGQFIQDVAPDEVKDDLDFFRFPRILPDMPFYEDAPIDGFMVPAKAKHKEAARKFLKFTITPSSQDFFSTRLSRLAALKDIPPPSKMAEKGLEMITESEGVASFYDRDTVPEMARRGMNAFVEFMDEPDRIDEILIQLEQDRQRIFRDNAE
jgi:multiple sugar transport system substrate-binding protein